MKKIIKSAFLLFSAITFAQETKTVQVYQYVNGVRSITPVKTIEISTIGGTSALKTEIYNNTNGIKNLTPETIIKPNGYVYKVENGIQSLFPIQRLEVQNNSPILPNVNSIGSGWFNLFD
jgi:hypothetical protein